MKNTGIEYLSGEHELIVLPEMAELLPPLSEEQLSLLEADMLKNGCLNPIIVNQDLVIIDGHHRFGICENNLLPYRVVVLSFEDLLEAKQWALDTQKSRRNLEKWELGKIALKLKPDIEAKARKKQSGAGGDNMSASAKALRATLPEAVKDEYLCRNELGKTVGIGARTMGKVMKIDEYAPQNVKEALDNRQIKIHEAYGITQKLKELPEEEREALAQMLLEGKKDDEEAKRLGVIAKSYCSAFEKCDLLDISIENIRIWIDFASIRSDMLEVWANDARGFAKKFNEFADIVQTTIIPNDIRRQNNKGDENNE